jgi:cytochrome c biogenesis protein CcdA
MAQRVADDPSEYIRIILPMAAQSKYGSSSVSWVVRFDEKKTASNREWNYNSRGRSRLMPQKALAGLRTLCNDISPKIRLEAFFALLAVRQPININKFIETVNSFPDQRAIAERISEFVLGNYRSLDSNFKPLLAYLNEDRNSSEISKVYRHFGVSENSGDIEIKYLLKSDKDTKDAMASFVAVKNEEKNEAEKDSMITLVYFYKSGCRDCARVEKFLEQIKSLAPEIDIKKLNIGKIRNMRINEAYCEKFNVPENVRLVAPSVFSGAGYLIKDINYDKLFKFAVKASRVKDQNWHKVKEDELEFSETKISERYKKISYGIIAAAGALDGINPCAFATIIFFISYLVIARKNPREIAQVAIAFICGVFIAYYLLGLGLVEIVIRFSLIKHLGDWFNRILALIALLIMALSIYDGIMCLKGKMGSMAMQLPDFLKERIRSSIRTGARRRNFVIAAFVTGLVVSVLELACTGQVYAPTILFMLKTGADRIGALIYLAVYNIFFIFPLAVIFIFAYFGMKSDALIKLMQKHSASVKFGIALLFFVLFLALTFGDKLFLF